MRFVNANYRKLILEAEKGFLVSMGAQNLSQHTLGWNLDKIGAFKGQYFPHKNFIFVLSRVSYMTYVPFQISCRVPLNFFISAKKTHYFTFYSEFQFFLFPVEQSCKYDYYILDISTYRIIFFLFWFLFIDKMVIFTIFTLLVRKMHQIFFPFSSIKR